MLESPSRVPKTRIFAEFPNKFWANVLADWVGAQGQVKLAKKKQNTPNCDVIPRKTHIQNEKLFFSSVV